MDTKCKICKQTLDDPDDRTTRDCGGDCLKCMAGAGDPDCIKEMIEIMCRPKSEAERAGWLDLDI